MNYVIVLISSPKHNFISWCKIFLYYRNLIPAPNWTPSHILKRNKQYKWYINYQRNENQFSLSPNSKGFSWQWFFKINVLIICHPYRAFTFSNKAHNFEITIIHSRGPQKQSSCMKDCLYNTIFTNKNRPPEAFYYIL